MRKSLLFWSAVTISFLISGEITEAQKEMLEELPADQRNSLLEKMTKAESLNKEIEEVFEEESSLIKRKEYENLEEDEVSCEECIYGYSFFKYSPSTFAPVSNIPVSSNYILGPGDKLVVSYFGNENNEEEIYISREGNISLPMLGPINLIGLTFEDANTYIKNKVRNELIGTDVSVSLKELRSINVYLLGEAYNPGQFTLSALSTVTNALFVAGGVNENGSLRNIQIRRGKQIIANYDFYDFLLKGSLSSDVKLQDGDIIFIPFIENKIKVGGFFKRPGFYEFLEGETLADAVQLAGGFQLDVMPDINLEISSIDKITSSRELFYIEQNSIELKRPLKNGDQINIASSQKTITGTIKLSGEIMNPGEYTIQKGDTVLDIINRAGGYTDESYTQGAVFLRKAVAEQQKEAFLRSAEQLELTLIDTITEGQLVVSNQFSLAPLTELIARLREEEPLGRQIVNLDYLSLKTDPYINFPVQDGDELYVPKRPYSVSVVGEVLNSSTLPYDPDMKVTDYINSAGGLNENADREKIFIIYPDGKSKLSKKSLFSEKDDVLPGSTIVVSRDSKPWDAIKLTTIITPILADLATSAAAIAAISD
tara:strand:+ start:1824 stop:3614 length:1791 start_codon:yes stop_codon:yes gene_type:complete